MTPLREDRKSPNHPASGKAGIASRFAVGHPWPGLPEPLAPIKRMNRTCLYMLVAMAIQSFCHSQVTKLPADDLKVLGEVSRFRQIQAATNLPPEVFALCADKRHGLAEPGQKWEEGDYIVDKTLPRQRLIWAVTDNNYYVVHCEIGGYVLRYFVLVAKLKVGESKPSFVWRASAMRQLKDFKEFLAALATNDLNDSRSP